jgi:hypothetical protein
MDLDTDRDCRGGERTEFLAALIAAGLELNDKGAIRWNKDNRRHPRNWSAGLKAYSSTVILILEFVTCVFLEQSVVEGVVKLTTAPRTAISTAGVSRRHEKKPSSQSRVLHLLTRHSRLRPHYKLKQTMASAPAFRSSRSPRCTLTNPPTQN